jgi:ankyrin repeat protein
MYLFPQTAITVNARMFDGNTALHIAVQEGDLLMCRLLMEAGVSYA